MSESEDEPFDCVDCEWSGHNPEHISWDDRVLHHGERQNHYGGGVTSPGHIYGTYYVGSYGSYNRCPECGSRALTASRREYERQVEKATGLFVAGIFGLFMFAFLLEGML